MKINEPNYFGEIDVEGTREEINGLIGYLQLVGVFVYHKNYASIEDFRIDYETYAIVLKPVEVDEFKKYLKL